MPPAEGALPPWMESFLASLRVAPPPFQPEPGPPGRGYAELNRRSADLGNYLDQPAARPEVAATAERSLAPVPMERAVPLRMSPATPMAAQARTRGRLERRARVDAERGVNFSELTEETRTPTSTIRVGVLDRVPRPVSSSDVEREMNQGVSREMAALLDTIAEAEGTSILPAGGWGSIWGDTPRGAGDRRFTDFSRHPGRFFPGPDGPSSAAGRYQITNTTYQDAARQLGITDFTPASQTRIAAHLAQQAYGPGLERDLRDPSKWEDIARRLSPVWASLPFHPTQRRFSMDQFSRVLQERLGRRTEASPREPMDFIAPHGAGPSFLPQRRAEPLR